jgi:hypothetical protein
MVALNAGLKLAYFPYRRSLTEITRMTQASTKQANNALTEHSVILVYGEYQEPTTCRPKPKTNTEYDPLHDHAAPFFTCIQIPRSNLGQNTG